MRKRPYLAAFVLGAVLVGCALPAVCQNDDPTWVEYGNRYVKVLIGTAGKFEAG